MVGEPIQATNKGNFAKHTEAMKPESIASFATSSCTGLASLADKEAGC